MNFDGKIALVTGASSGMGAATARLLADNGARVFTAQRSEAGFEDISIDLMKPAAAETVISKISEGAGQLDILINNAGMMCEGAVDETSDADWQNQIALNLTTPFLLTRAAIAMLRVSLTIGMRGFQQSNGSTFFASC